MMKDAAVPGLSVAVVSRDRVLFAGGYGLADRGSNRRADAATAYLWFSMSKLVTATAALRLADEGRLDLDAAITEYLDYWPVSGRTQPTVRQLLTHTAGLANPLPIRWVHPAGAERPDPDTMLRRLMRKGPGYRYPIGQRARYSNLGYLAAGQVIAAAAQMPFEAFVQDSVLRPLGMQHTGFSYATQAAPATGYVKAPPMIGPLLRRVLPHDIAGDRSGPYLALHPFYVDGAAYGGLVGDVVDAGRFLRMHLRDGELDGNRVLGTRTAHTMRTINHPGQPFDHGIGWFRRPAIRSAAWVEHFGAGAGFWNVMRLYPDRGLGVVVMSNSTRTYNFEPLFALLTASWS